MGSTEASTERVLSPNAFVHVVLRTTQQNYLAMTQFYKTFLGAYAAYENDSIAFLRYDEEHHRIGIFAVPNTDPKIATSCGLEHMSFAFTTLKDLSVSYQQKKAHGILPYWSVNHGPATSFYYKDPDGNKIETQVDNMTAEDATTFMTSREFGENPIGVEFDPEEFVRRVESGEDEAVIKKRPDDGPRGIPSHI